MISFFCLLVALGIQPDRPESSVVVAPANIAALAARDWTDVTGTKRARATLIHVDGEKLWLRRADGRMAKATLASLSRPDQVYVSSKLMQLSRKVATQNSPSAVSSILGTVVDKAASLGELPGWLPQNQLPVVSTVTPAALIYVRISRGFLEDYVERSVNQRKPVTDLVLGTPIKGESITKGKTQLRLKPSSQGALGEIIFSGTVHARTTGRNGPAILHYASDTDFQSRKSIKMDGTGIHVSGATTHSPTDLRITGIASTLPGLRGRIVKRIASRRASSSHNQAERITADHTGARVGRDFDKRIEASMAKVEKVLLSKIPELSFDNDRGQANMRFRSTNDYVEMAMVRSDATAEERSLRPPAIEGTPDFAIRVHRTLITSALADPEVTETLAPAFGRLLNARIAESATAAIAADTTAADDSTKWSVGLDWLTLDFKEVD